MNSYRKQEQANRFCGQIKAVSTPPWCLSLGPKVTRVSEGMTLSWKKYGNTHQHQRLLNIQNMSGHKVFLPDQRVSETESSLLDSIQKTGGGGRMKRRMTEAKTGSGEERECLKILQSETVIVLRRLYLSSNTRPGETHSNMNFPKSLTFNLSILVTSHFFSNIAKTWPVGLRLKIALNQELEILHANF